jgi:hypothetical protein
LQRKELCWLGLGILLAASLSVYVSPWIARYRQHNRLRAAIPRVYAEVYGQRQSITTAIESYKQALNFYPPDHVLQQKPLVVDAFTNTLLYELVGSLHDSTNHFFEPAGFPPISAQTVRKYFHIDRFANTVEQGAEIRHFLDASNIIATMAVNQKPDVALLAYFPSWEGIEPELLGEIELGSWHYNQSAPVHNPGRYDLWIEIHTPLTNIVIGNW